MFSRNLPIVCLALGAACNAPPSPYAASNAIRVELGEIQTGSPAAALTTEVPIGTTWLVSGHFARGFTDPPEVLIVMIQSPRGDLENEAAGPVTARGDRLQFSLQVKPPRTPGKKRIVIKNGIGNQVLAEFTLNTVK